MPVRVGMVRPQRLADQLDALRRPAGPVISEGCLDTVVPRSCVNGQPVTARALRSGRHPLMPVNAMFSMIRRRRSKNTISIGTVLNVEPAISFP